MDRGEFKRHAWKYDHQLVPSLASVCLLRPSWCEDGAAADEAEAADCMVWLASNNPRRAWRASKERKMET